MPIGDPTLARQSYLTVLEFFNGVLWGENRRRKNPPSRIGSRKRLEADWGFSTLEYEACSLRYASFQLLLVMPCPYSSSYCHFPKLSSCHLCVNKPPTSWGDRHILGSAPVGRVWWPFLQNKLVLSATDTAVPVHLPGGVWEHCISKLSHSTTAFF